MTKNSKLSLIAAIPAFIALFVVRLLLVAKGTDFDTGFLYDENGFLINFSFYGLLIITLAVLIVFSILDRRKGSSCHTSDFSAFVDAKAVMMGFPLLVAGSIAMYEGYMQTGALTPSGFIIFVDFVLGAAMTILGFIILYKKEFTPLLGFCMIVPALYYTLRGIGVFLDRMAVVTVPEYLIECLFYIGAAIFFMQTAKLMTGNETKTTRVMITVTGLTSALMLLSNAFAVIAADLFVPSVSGSIETNAIAAEIEHQKMLSQYMLGYHMSYSSWVDISIAVCMVLTVVALYLKSKPADKQQTEQA